MAIIERYKQEYRSAIEIYRHYLERAKVNPKGNLQFNQEVIKLYPDPSNRRKALKVFFEQGTVSKRDFAKQKQILEIYDTASKRETSG